MFHYNNHNQPRFQTPSIGAASRQRSQQQNFDSFHPSKGIENRLQNENYHDSYSMNKPSFNTQQINKRSKQRRFGTNLTHKKAITRVNHNNQYHDNKQSKTLQLFKPSKKIHFKSRNQNENVMINKKKFNNNQFSKSSFKFNINIGMKNKHKLAQNEMEQNETEYCPKGTSWKPSINKSLQKLFKKAFKVIGEYKLFVASDKTSKIDYEIQEDFDMIQEPKMSNNCLYESDSDCTVDNDYGDSNNDNGYQYEPFSFALSPQNCDIPLDDIEIEEIRLECQLFL